MYPQNFSDIDANRFLTEPLSYPEVRDPYRTLERIQALQQILNRTPLIDDVWVYYTQSQIWIHTSGWTDLRAADLPRDFDRGWFRQMTSQKPGQTWLVRSTQKADGPATVLDQVTVAPGIVVAVEVRTSAMADLITSGLGAQGPGRGESAYLVHRDWGIVSAGGEPRDSRLALQAWDRQAGPSSATTTSDRGQSYNVGAQSSQVDGWTLLVVKPIQNLDNRFFQMQLFVVIFGLVLLGVDLAVAWFLNRRVNRPLGDLLETLRKIGEKNSFPDWDPRRTFVPSSFPYWLARRIDELQGTATRHQESIRYLSILGLLKGRETSEPDPGLWDALGLVDHEAVAFTVLLHKPEAVPAPDWLTVKTQVSRMLTEALAPAGTVLIDENQTLVGVLAVAPGTSGWARLEEVVAATGQTAHLGLRVAVGSQGAATPEALGVSFRESEHWARYAWLVEYGVLLDAQTLGVATRREFTLKAAWTDQFAGALRHGNVEALGGMARTLVAEVSRGHFTVESVADGLAEIVYQLRRTLVQDDPGFEDRWGLDLTTSFRQLPGLSGFLPWFDQVMTLGFLSRTSEGSGEFVLSKAIAEFVAENLYHDLSLVTMADGLHLNPSYLSRIFKGVMGVSFWDYVTEAKLGRAEELVREGRLSIKELSYRLGYRSVQHFIKLFKARTGTTPVEFRHRQQNATTARD